MKSERNNSLEINLEANNTIGSEKSKMKLEIKSDCEMGFAVNVFVQLFKQDKDMAMAARLAMLVDMMGADKIGDVLDKLTDDNVSDSDFSEFLKNTKTAQA